MHDWQIELEQIRKEVQELKSMENKVSKFIVTASIMLLSKLKVRLDYNIMRGTGSP